jgi:cyclophilin family peptidyl-prolyl cis-trans isomerase
MPTNPAERNNMYSAPPALQIDFDKIYTAILETEKGDIVVELFADKVPNTVSNFVFLARQGFYDDTTFHRVIPGFMAQAGDPTGTGTGGPGYDFYDEFHPDLKHDRPGILSMANSGANTNGSQFFITYAPAPWLDAYDENGNLKNCIRRDVSCHAVFGRVTEGMDVLQAIMPRDPARAQTPGDLIRTIRIKEQ